MENPLIKFLQQFGEMSINEQSIIKEAFHPENFKAGGAISNAGDVAEHLYFINKGILKITLIGEDLKELTYFFLKPQQMMSFLHSLYSGIPVVQGLRAATDLELWVINKSGLELLFEQIPYFKSMLDKIANLSMVEMINIKNNYITGDGLKRYKLFLQTQPEIALHVAQGDVATYLGITPQSLSRIRKKI